MRRLRFRSPRKSDLQSLQRFLLAEHAHHVRDTCADLFNATVSIALGQVKNRGKTRLLARQGMPQRRHDLFGRLLAARPRQYKLVEFVSDRRTRRRALDRGRVGECAVRQRRERIDGFFQGLPCNVSAS